MYLQYTLIDVFLIPLVDTEVSSGATGECNILQVENHCLLTFAGKDTTVVNILIRLMSMGIENSFTTDDLGQFWHVLFDNPI